MSRTSTLLSTASPFGPPDTWPAVYRSTVSIPKHVADRIDQLCPLCGIHTWICQWAYKQIYDELQTYGPSLTDSIDGANTVIAITKRLTLRPTNVAEPRDNVSRAAGGTRRKPSTSARPASTQGRHRKVGNDQAKGTHPEQA